METWESGALILVEEGGLAHLRQAPGAGVQPPKGSLSSEERCTSVDEGFRDQAVYSGMLLVDLVRVRSKGTLVQQLLPGGAVRRTRWSCDQRNAQFLEDWAQCPGKQQHSTHQSDVRSRRTIFLKLLARPARLRKVLHRDRADGASFISILRGLPSP